MDDGASTVEELTQKIGRVYREKLESLLHACGVTPDNWTDFVLVDRDSENVTRQDVMKDGEVLGFIAVKAVHGDDGSVTFRIYGGTNSGEEETATDP